MAENTIILYTTNNLEIEDFAIKVSEYLNLKRVSISFFESDLFELAITKNDEFDEKRQRQFPDGFLYFKFTLEFYFKNQIIDDLHIELINKTLRWLWDKNMPTVAAGDYEEKLSHSGGYKDTSLPWPDKT